MRNGLVSALCLGVVALLALPASADIKAFNAAVSNGDYKAAATEAANTWPMLDKSRKDIAIIAHEFGYAAYMSGDYKASRGYAAFAISASANPEAQFQATSTILLKLSEHRLKATQATRDALMAALVQRATLPGFDDISSLGMDAVVDWDLSKRAWDQVRKSSSLGVKLATAGGGYYLHRLRHMETTSVAAETTGDTIKAGYASMINMEETIIGDIDAAQSDEAARRFVPVFWETRA